MLYHRGADDLADGQAASEMRMHVAGSRLAFHLSALRQAPGRSREQKAEDTSRRSRDRTTASFEPAPSAGADTIRRESVVTIGIRNGRNSPILSNAHGGQHPGGRQRAQVVA